VPTNSKLKGLKIMDEKTQAAIDKAASKAAKAEQKRISDAIKEIGIDLDLGVAKVQRSFRKACLEAVKNSA
jgi:tRNA uridine 5-carbamoylmethylation protein Kti12